MPYQLFNFSLRDIGINTNKNVFCLVDLLVDLICHGVGVAMSPAPVIINYLGFPDSARVKTVTHRITDIIADPTANEPNYTEQLLYMPRCFVCWSLFDIVERKVLPCDCKCSKDVIVHWKYVEKRDII